MAGLAMPENGNQVTPKGSRQGIIQDRGFGAIYPVAVHYQLTRPLSGQATKSRLARLFGEFMTPSKKYGYE